jgi:hypothetical protein
VCVCLPIRNTVMEQRMHNRGDHEEHFYLITILMSYCAIATISVFISFFFFFYLSIETCIPDSVNVPFEPIRPEARKKKEKPSCV